jgi:hypothetical protein
MYKLKELIKNLSVNGIHLPYAHDVTTGKGSATLLFFYIFGLSTLFSLFTLHLITTLEMAMSTGMTIVAWTFSYVFYRMRKLDKVKFDLDDKSIEIEGDDEEEKN